MEYRITISDYSKALKVLKEGFIIGFSAITFFTFLVNRYIAFPSTIGFVLLPLSIFAGPIYIFMRNRKNSAKESIIVGSGNIAGKKYGNLEFKNIKSFKYKTFKYDVLILEMYSGTKYAIAYDMNNFGDYFDFIDTFSKMTNEENKKRKNMGIEEIIEKKSFSKYLKIIITILSVLLSTIYLIKKCL